MLACAGARQMHNLTLVMSQAPLDIEAGQSEISHRAISVRKLSALRAQELASGRQVEEEVLARC